MELALPILALSSMYLISNQPKPNGQPKGQIKGTRESFSNQSNHVNQTKALPNTNVPVGNYPTMNNRQLMDTNQAYPNPNVATNSYLDQNVYEQRERNGQEVGSEIQQVYLMSGERINSDDFSKGMVPFTGSKPHGQTYNNNYAETILDSYSGSGSQVVKKIEQAPLFKPQENVQWTYGMPGASDFIQSRQLPVLRNNMVKPFEPTMVGPGLDQGYGSEGSLGFNAGMEARDKWLPKTADELRVLTNPKQEYTLDNLQGPASTSIKNVGIEGKVEKYRPDTFYVNSQDRWFTTTGAEQKGQLIPDHIIKPSVRNETSTHYQGISNSAIKTAGYIPGKHEQTKRIQLEGFDVGCSSAVKTAPHQHKSFENHQQSHTNYVNNRNLNPQQTQFGSGFSSAIGAIVAPLMDILKPSKKDEYGSNMRIYGNSMGVGSVTGSYVQTPGDVPGTTIKETTLYEPRSYIGNQQENAAYLVNNQQPIANQRDTTNHNQFMGASSKHGSMVYDAAYNQTNNELKEGTIHNRIANGNAKHFNNQMNISVSKLESDRENRWASAPKAAITSGPSLQVYGQTNLVPIDPNHVNHNQNDMSQSRINPDLLNAFRANPYTHSLASVV